MVIASEKIQAFANCFMGMCLFSRRSSFGLIMTHLYNLRMCRMCNILDKHSSSQRVYGTAASSVLISDKDDSCSCLSSDSNVEIEKSEKVEPFLMQRELRPHNCKERKLFLTVGRVIKSMEWEIAREIRFRGAVLNYGFPRAIDVFRILVHSFACARMHMEVYALLRDVLSFYQEVEFDMFGLFPTMLDSFDDVSRLVVVDVLIKLFASNSLLENAMDVFIQARKIGVEPNIRSCNFLLKCLTEARRKESALRLFEKMKNSGPSPNIYTYTIIMNLYCNGHCVLGKEDMREATKILEEMKTRGVCCSVVTYSTYIHGLCRVGCVQNAVDFIRKLRQNNQPLNNYCYNAIIHGLCQEGELDEALRVFEEMRCCGITPDVYSYSILIDGFCKCGDVVKGLSFIEEMGKSNIKPSIVSYCSLLRGLCKSGIDFHKFQAAGYEFDQDNYKMLVNVLCSQGLEEMISNNLARNASTYERLIHGYYRIGSFDKALELLNAMNKEGILPSTFAYNIIVNGYCSKGLVGKHCK